MLLFIFRCAMCHWNLFETWKILFMIKWTNHCFNWNPLLICTAYLAMLSVLYEKRRKKKTICCICQSNYRHRKSMKKTYGRWWWTDGQKWTTDRLFVHLDAGIRRKRKRLHDIQWAKSLTKKENRTHNWFSSFVKDWIFLYDLIISYGIIEHYFRFLFSPIEYKRFLISMKMYNENRSAVPDNTKFSNRMFDEWRHLAD
jgi:hypothetical protein